MKYYRHIDGLRGIAVASVVLFHADLAGFSGGFVGVDIFFVISGFLITSIIAEHVRSGDFSLLQFYDRRIRRIFPPLIAVYIVCSMAALVVLLPKDFMRFSDSLSASAFFFSNHYFYDQSGYFDTAAHTKPLLHTWSLAVEEQFYLLWPIALLALWRIRSTAWRLVIIAAAGFASLIGAEVLIAFQDSEAAFYLLPARAWELLLGAMLALTLSRLPIGALAANVLAALGIGLIAVAVAGLSPASHFPGTTALLPCLGAAFLIAAGYRHTPLLTRLYVNGPAVALGLISYSLYLWHWPLFVFWRLWQERAPTPLEACGLIALSLCLAALSYRWIEQPFRRGWVGLPGRRTVTIGIACMALFAAFGGIGKLQHGFPGRYSDEVSEILVVSGQKKSALPCGTASSIARGDAACRLGVPPTPRTPRVLLAGDSHAEHYAPPLDEMMKRQGMSGQLMRRGGCPPILDESLLPHPASDLDRCKLLSAQIREALTTYHFDIFVVAMRWDSYTEHEWPAPPGEASASGPAVPPATEAARRKMEAAMRHLVETLREKGTQVVFLGQIPPFRIDPVRCLVKARMQNTPDSACFASADTVRKRLQFSNDLIRRLAEEYDTAHAFIASDATCDREICSPFVNGVFTYRDGNHLNLEGGRLWSAYLAKVPAFARPRQQARREAPRGALLP